MQFAITRRCEPSGFVITQSQDVIVNPRLSSLITTRHHIRPLKKFSHNHPMNTQTTFTKPITTAAPLRNPSPNQPPKTNKPIKRTSPSDTKKRILFYYEHQRRLSSPSSQTAVSAHGPGHSLAVFGTNWQPLVVSGRTFLEEIFSQAIAETRPDTSRYTKTHL
ncbi:MAG: hypothetical protein ACXWDN_16090 [Limisphaerales bacterium]